MGFLFGSNKGPTIPEITGLQIQTAVNVLPIPIIYGCPRVPINLIYANGFRAVAQKAQGGKGLLSGGKGATTGYKYYASFIGALGEGPLGPILGIFDDQQVYTMHTVPDGKNYTFYPGTDTQTPVPTIVSTWPNDAFSYKDTAYVWSFDYLLDSSATVPQLNFIPTGLFAGSCPLNVYNSLDGSETNLHLDADPALCINDFLTNPRYGVGFPSTYIDSSTLFTSTNGFNSAVGDAALATYCQAVGFGWSVVLNNSEPARSVLDRWCKNLGVAIVWTGYTLKFIPYWDTFTGNNPNWDPAAGVPKKYFAPVVQPLFDLTDLDFVQTPAGDDPLVMSRVDAIDVKNVVRLNFRDRNVLFNDNVVEAKDEATVQRFGPRTERMGTADEFSLMSYAAAAAQVNLQRNIAIRRTFEFKLPSIYCILDPMDIVTLTDTTLNLNKFPVRIQSIEEDEKGILTIKAEEFPIGSLSATLYSRQANLPPTILNTNIAPAPVNPPVIFEPTAPMLAAQGLVSPTVVIGASGGTGGVADPNWGGCNVWVSNDNISYSQLGTINAPARQGVTTATLAAFIGANPDLVNTLSVDLTESGGSLASVTTDQAIQGLSLCAIVDAAGDLELLGYTIATLTAPNKYNLTGLYRGMYGTIACSHASGSKFLRVDELISELILPTALLNTTLYVKLQSFNVSNLEPQDISTCVAYSFTPLGAGTNVLANPVVSALLAGMSIDCNSGDGTLDLNLGGSGACAPVVLTLDLEAL